MAHARALGLARGMEWVAKTYQAAHAGFVGNHTRDSPTEGFAADHKPVRAAEFFDRIAPGLNQRRFAIGRTARTGFSPPPHVWKLKSRGPDAGFRDSRGDGFHERGIHRTSRTVGENERNRSPFRAIE
jgi:hypothetical protein